MEPLAGSPHPPQPPYNRISESYFCAQARLKRTIQTQNSALRAVLGKRTLIFTAQAQLKRTFCTGAVFLRSRKKPLKTTAPVQKSRWSSKPLKTDGNLTILTEKVGQPRADWPLFLNSRAAGRRTTEKHAKSISRAPPGHLLGTSRAPCFCKFAHACAQKLKKKQFHEPFFFQFVCTGVVEAHFSIKSTGERSEP